jgi:hypothetical protein
MIIWIVVQRDTGAALGTKMERVAGKISMRRPVPSIMHRLKLPQPREGKENEDNG